MKKINEIEWEVIIPISILIIILIVGTYLIEHGWFLCQ